MIEHLYKINFVLLFLFMSSSGHPKAQQNSGLDSLQFLTGTWTGSGTGEPGQGVGEFSFNFDLQGKVLIRKSFAEYPAANEKPAYRHDDIMIIYKDSDSKTKAIYFDNEGHIINYTVSFSDDGSSLVFLSDYTVSSPRFRLTYTKINNGSLGIVFDIAPPGKPNSFAPYIDAAAKRK